MSMKTILVPMENDDAMRSALETALLLARRCESYMEGFALRSGINEFVSVDVMGGIPPETYRHDLAEVAEQARDIFESFMQRNHVPRSTATTRSLSFGWLDYAPEGETFVGSYGRVFDVIVMNRPDELRAACITEPLNSACSRADGRSYYLRRRHQSRSLPTCWSHGIAARNRPEPPLAMPLLQQADRVTVLTVTGGTAVPGPPHSN